MVRGLLMLRGRTGKYISLLARFVEDHAADSALLVELLKKGDLATAQRQAHSVKGAAATLGADALAEAAKQIELRLRNVDSSATVDAIAAVADTLVAELAEFDARLQAIGVLVGAGVAEATADTSTPAEKLAPHVLDTLQHRLSDLDVRAVDLCQEQALALRAHFGQAANARVDEMLALVRAYDFASALAVLRALRQTGSVSIPDAVSPPPTLVKST